MLRIGREALTANDPAQAAHHAAAALSVAPLDPDVRALVDAILDRPLGLGAQIRGWLTARSGASHFPADGFAGNFAARARALERAGLVSEALDLLLQLAHALPQRPFLDWALEIVRGSEDALEAGTILTMYGEVAGSTIGLVRLRRGERAPFERWAELVEAMIPRVEEDVRPMLHVIHSAFLRRLGRFEEAAEAARRGQAAESLADTSLGLALRGAGPASGISHEGLDLDHIRSQVAETLPGQRTCDHG